MQGRRQQGITGDACVASPIHQGHSLPRSTYQLDHLPYFSSPHFHETETFPWHRFPPLAQQVLGPHHVAYPLKPACTLNKAP